MSEMGAATEAAVSFHPVGNLCRVCGLLVGVLLVIALIAYAAIPPVYEARCEFAFGCRGRFSNDNGVDVGMYSGSYEEIFNTRLSMWRSDKIITKIVREYRADFPASTTTDKEIIDALVGSGLELVRHSRLIVIAVRSRSPQLAAALANAYAKAIQSLTDEENQDRCNHAIAEITARLEKQRRMDEDIILRLMKFQSENNTDEMKARRVELEAKAQKNNGEKLKFQNAIEVAKEKLARLQEMQFKAETFDRVSTSATFPDELRKTGESLRKAGLEMNQLLTTHRKDNPAVMAKERELQLLQADFSTTVSNELTITEKSLGAFNKQLEILEEHGRQYQRQITQLSQAIVSADAGLRQLKKEREVSAMMLKDFRQRENEAHICCERDNEVVTVLKRAEVPTRPCNFIPKLFWILSGGRCHAK